VFKDNLNPTYTVVLIPGEIPMRNKAALPWFVQIFAIVCAVSLCFTSWAYAQTTPPSVDFNCNSKLNNVNFKVQIAPNLPNTVPGPSLNQAGADCMAWQTFIALSWAADPNNPGQPDKNVPASKFGTPGIPNNPKQPIVPVVWESYQEVSNVIGENPVQNWRTPQVMPERFRKFSKIADLAPTSKFGFKTLTATSKFTDGPEFVMDKTTEAFTHSWLTAQNQSLTFYEIRLNQNEYRYITENTLNRPQSQLDCATGAAGLNLPSGTAGDNQDLDCQNKASNYGADGAIEVKAAWVELKDSSLYPKYKIAQAIIQGPNDPQPRKAIMGLVGLHIIHKVPNAQQLVWATFEHIDNAPSQQDIDSGKPLKTSYTYYNPNCDPKKDPYNCKWNYQPQPEKKDSYTTPVQVVRLNSIPSISNALNQAVWSTLQQVNASSVFQNYQLIDTMWPKSSQAIPSKSTTPLSNGNIQSATYQNYVSNTTLETYFQQPSQQPNSHQLFTPGGCLGCHVLAPIASPSKLGQRARITLFSPSLTQENQKTNVSYASDYSFVFHHAQKISKAK
jgi:hypothetical protein